MAKKKDKLQVVNNIQELNLEIDYDKLAKAIVGAKSEVDTIEQYANNKKEITERINNLIAKRDEEAPKTEIDLDVYAKKASEIVDFIKRPDVTEKAKNEALRTIIEKVVYEKANNNLAIYFSEF